LHDHNINICLGTDSLASNNALDMRSEMREVKKFHRLSDREVLEMATLNGARALGQVGKLGQISPGSLADLVAFPHASDESDVDPYRQVVQSKTEPSLLLVNGRRVEIGGESK
jgi:cytosine/adenosine deaminase-related metal-dependent hydrolase